MWHLFLHISWVTKTSIVTMTCDYQRMNCGLQAYLCWFVMGGWRTSQSTFNNNLNNKSVQQNLVNQKRHYDTKWIYHWCTWHLNFKKMIYTKRNSTTKRDNSNFHILEWHHYKLLIYFEGLFMKEIINTMSKYLIKLEQCLVDFKQKTKNLS